MDQKKKIPGYLIAWFAIMAIGAVLMFTGITHESLWYDESYTGAIVNQPFSHIMDITGGDNHPPLYYIMLRVFILVFGNSVFSLRAFSAIGALALAALGIGPVRRAMGDRTGMLYTLLTLFLPITVSMAHEARMYTWAAFFVAGSALYGYFGYEGGKNRDWILFGLFSLCAAYTHYYSLLAVVMICALLFLLTLISKKRLVPFLYAAGAVVLAYIPWVFKLAGAVKRVKVNYWIPPVTGKVIQGVFVYPFNNKFSIPVNPSLPLIGLLIAVTVMCIGIISQMIRREKSAVPAALAVAAYILTITAGIAASHIIRPVLVDRYMVTVLGLFVMGVSYGMANLGKKLSPSVIVAALLLLISGMQTTFTITNRFNGPMKEAVSTLEVKPGDIFLHVDEHTLGTFSYYYPDNMNYYYIREGAGGYSNYDAFRPNGLVIDSLDQIDKSRRIWLVERFGGTDMISASSWLRSGLLRSDGTSATFGLPLSWYGFKVYRVRFSDGETEAFSTTRYGSLTVRMSGFDNDTGKAVVAVYADGNMNIPLKNQVVNITNKKAEAVFEDLEFGEYAILCIHDMNGNRDVDMKANIPTEGLGYSNSNTAPEGPPEFDKCSFYFDENNLVVDITMFYIK